MEKFKPVKPEERIIISVRLYPDVVKRIDTQSAKMDISRNEMISQMIQFALDNMETE